MTPPTTIRPTIELTTAINTVWFIPLSAVSEVTTIVLFTTVAGEEELRAFAGL